MATKDSKPSASPQQAKSAAKVLAAKSAAAKTAIRGDGGGLSAYKRADLSRLMTPRRQAIISLSRPR